MTRINPPRRKPWKPYIYHFAMLYGKFKWLNRHGDGTITIPVRKWCAHFNTKPKTLKEAISFLQAIGGVESFSWHSDWVHVKPAVPTDMCRRVEIMDTGVEIEAELITLSEQAPAPLNKEEKVENEQ